MKAGLRTHKCLATLYFPKSLIPSHPKRTVGVSKKTHHLLTVAGAVQGLFNTHLFPVSPVKLAPSQELINAINNAVSESGSVRFKANLSNQSEKNKGWGDKRFSLKKKRVTLVTRFFLSDIF